MTWPEALVYITLIAIGVPGFVGAMWVVTRQSTRSLRDSIGDSSPPTWTSTITTKGDDEGHGPFAPYQ